MTFVDKAWRSETGKRVSLDWTQYPYGGKGATGAIACDVWAAVAPSGPFQMTGNAGGIAVLSDGRVRWAELKDDSAVPYDVPISKVKSVQLSVRDGIMVGLVNGQEVLRRKKPNYYVHIPDQMRIEALDSAPLVVSEIRWRNAGLGKAPLTKFGEVWPAVGKLRDNQSIAEVTKILGVKGGLFEEGTFPNGRWKILYFRKKTLYVVGAFLNDRIYGFQVRFSSQVPDWDIPRVLGVQFASGTWDKEPRVNGAPMDPRGWEYQFIRTGTLTNGASLVFDSADAINLFGEWRPEGKVLGIRR